ncbi:hypothetical protein AMJ44_15635 [candidate division WOR-1 bacterium DG_54_3]|uniref:DUF2971 domain-containing protein n=1 Tax=candidate division WOR-1 bacterium DG_54_3 TaxID=1703775 RepID=A0A0S7XJ14_UNCSA|nr:MAG: hypothetical protein AMJ44_15635 [candidate division WOR-1 bacterium DG_54_3]
MNNQGDHKVAHDIPDDPYKQADLDIRIWRYMSFVKFISLLELKALWFSRLGALEDQFEGTLPKGTRTKMINNSKKWFETFPDPELQNQLLESTDRNVDDGRCTTMVNCWYLGENESSYMWKNYAGDKNGIVIRSTVGRLRRSLWGDPKILRIGKVEYIYFETHDMSTYHGHQAGKRALLKHVKYQDEKELRVITHNDVTMDCLNPDGTEMSDRQKQGPGRFDPKRPGLYVKVQPHLLIESVFVAPNSSGWFLDLVKRIILRYEIDVPVQFSQINQ